MADKRCCRVLLCDPMGLRADTLMPTGHHFTNGKHESQSLFFKGQETTQPGLTSVPSTPVRPINTPVIEFEHSAVAIKALTFNHCCGSGSLCACDLGDGGGVGSGEGQFGFLGRVTESPTRRKEKD